MEKNSTPLQFDAVFSSRGQCKIIYLLATRLELNISEIIKVTGLHHTAVARYLETLKQLNFVAEKQYGTIRIFRFKIENLNARTVQLMIQLWENRLNTES